MLKVILFTAIISSNLNIGIGQSDTIARISIKEAQINYTKGNYTKTLQILENIEKESDSFNSQSQYLRIRTQYEIISNNPYADMPLLRAIKTNIDQYILSNSTQESLKDNIESTLKIRTEINNLSNNEYTISGFNSLYKRDTTAAFSFFLKASLLEDPEAMNQLGRLFEFGYNKMKPNLAKALEWYKRSANKGNSDAMRTVGSMYAWGRNVTTNYSEAMNWYSKAADKGNSSARKVILIQSYHLLCYAVVTKNTSEGIKWLLKVAGKNDIFAMALIGNLYDRGEDIQKDYQQAVYWYSKVFAMGDYKYAIYISGLYCKGGYGLQRDTNLTNEWLKKAEDLDNGDGVILNAIGDYFNHEYNGFDRSNKRTVAMEWYKKAADLENINSIMSLGKIYKDENNYTEAVNWYRKAADKGYILAMHNIADLFSDNKNYSEAKNWYLKAAGKGDSVAMRKLGDLYSSDKNYAEALNWYLKGAEKGYEFCFLDLAKIYREGTGVKKSYAIAVDWYIKYFKKYNSSLTAFEISDLYSKGGYGLQRSQNLADEWLKKYEKYR